MFNYKNKSEKSEASVFISLKIGKTLKANLFNYDCTYLDILLVDQ